MAITILANGDKGVIGSPTHRLLRRLFEATGPTYFPAQRGASVTQLRALERHRWVALVRQGHTVLGAHLTARGECYLAMLDAAAEHQRLIAVAVAGVGPEYCGEPEDPACGPDLGLPWCRYHAGS